MHTRTGKIARLPAEIRTRLNRRIQDGESGVSLVAWLNSLPETQAVLQRCFEGREINEPNLSDWKNGGYREWLLHQETLDQVSSLAAEAAELNNAGQGRLSDYLSTILAARYASALAEWRAAGPGADAPKELRILRDFSRDVALLRRGDTESLRLRLHRADLEILGTYMEQKRRGSVGESFYAIIKCLTHPKIFECVADKNLTPEEKEAKLHEFVTVDLNIHPCVSPHKPAPVAPWPFPENSVPPSPDPYLPLAHPNILFRHPKLADILTPKPSRPAPDSSRHGEAAPDSSTHDAAAPETAFGRPPWC